MTLTYDPDQSRAALDLANDVRLSRARLKRDLKSGAIHFADLIDDPPTWAEGMKVTAALLSVPYIGPGKVHDMLARAGVSTLKTVGGLTSRQRTALLLQAPRLLARSVHL